MLRWGRLATLAAALTLVGYLGLATALWGYYRIHRKIPGVNWIDIVLVGRFHRVQSAIGAYYLAQAKEAWAAGDHFRGVLTARAATQKAPENLEAVLFLAKCWQDAGRFDEAIRALESGLGHHAKARSLQIAMVEVCLTSGRHEDLLRLLRTEFPKRGVDLLAGQDRGFQIAEVRATLETSGAAAAEAVVDGRPGLRDEVSAVPVMALIDWDLGRKQAAYDRLKRALATKPSDPALLESYIEFALRLGRRDEARRTARRFLDEQPNLVPAQIRYLETHDPDHPTDRQAWVDECLRCLIRYRRVPSAMQRLGNLAAVRGWTDLAFILYQTALQDNLSGFPYVVFYLGSLLKAGEYASADRVWQELGERNAPQLATIPFMNAMVAFGAGRRAEASLIVERLYRETEEKPRERGKLVESFRQFGFPALAEDLERARPAGAALATAR